VGRIHFFLLFWHTASVALHSGTRFSVMPHIILASQVLSKNATAGFGQGFLERVSAAQPLPLLIAAGYSNRIYHTWQRYHHAFAEPFRLWDPLPGRSLESEDAAPGAVHFRHHPDHASIRELTDVLSEIGFVNLKFPWNRLLLSKR
jgi:hypothetical protein